MIDKDAFCPKTGAPLSKEYHYDNRARSWRAVLPDEYTPTSDLPGELTNGAVQSSKAALFNYFRRCHKRHCEADDKLYRKAALGLRRLKSTAEGRTDWDVHVWYALQRRLDRAGFDVEWMHLYTEPRCPHCHGRLKYKLYDNGDITAQCGTRCTGNTGDKLHESRETIAELYSQAFGTPIDPEDFLQFG
jgi:hypothetical protein